MNLDKNLKSDLKSLKGIKIRVIFYQEKLNEIMINMRQRKKGKVDFFSLFYFQFWLNEKYLDTFIIDYK